MHPAPHRSFKYIVYPVRIFVSLTGPAERGANIALYRYAGCFKLWSPENWEVGYCVIETIQQDTASHHLYSALWNYIHFMLQGSLLHSQPQNSSEMLGPCSCHLFDGQWRHSGLVKKKQNIPFCSLCRSN